jgi:pilus assembly protein Flp/PilA
MRHLLHRFINDQSGVTAIEYGLIASLVAVAIIGAVSTLGTKLTTVFTQVSGSLT